MDKLTNKNLFKVVEIELQENCNMACSYCPNSTGERIEKGRMDWSSYDRIISQLHGVNFKGLLRFHFYNEPLLIKDLEHYISKARLSLPEVKIHIYTNGTLLSLDRFRSLVESGVDLFSVTKHENVESFIFEKTFSELSVEEKMLVRYKRHDELTLTNRGGELTCGSEEDLPLSLPCYIPRTNLTITLKGNIVLCYEDYSQRMVMGNILTEDIENIWMKPSYVEVRENLKKGRRGMYSICSACNNKQII